MSSQNTVRAGDVIRTAEGLDALPANAYFRCGCGYCGMKTGERAYVVGHRVLTAEKVADDHLPIEVLHVPGEEPTATPEVEAALAHRHRQGEQPMTTTDWIDDLERKAKAATPGPWSADGYGSGQQVTGATGTIFADKLALHEDAKFIAAADPDTILRLIEDNRRMRHGSLCPECNAKAWGERADFRRERDALAARLAAVEDLVAEWERVQEQNRKALGELARGTSHLLLDTPGPADFRAALAAPTDTTKEN